RRGARPRAPRGCGRAGARGEGVAGAPGRPGGAGAGRPRPPRPPLPEPVGAPPPHRPLLRGHVRRAALQLSRGRVSCALPVSRGGRAATRRARPAARPRPGGAWDRAPPPPPPPAPPHPPPPPTPSPPPLP